MGFQAVGAESSSQQSPLQNLGKQSSWQSLTLDDMENQLGQLGEPSRSMNLDEFLKSVSTSDLVQSMGIEAGDGPSTSSLPRQGSLDMPRTSKSKTVDYVWREIQQGQKMKNGEVFKTERELSMGEMTLEDFLAKTEVESSVSPVMGLDSVDAPQSFSQHMGLSPAPSLGIMSDAPMPGQKRNVPDAIDRSLDRKLRRKIKNRESAARSRARKQAYQNELVGKVSHLELENMKLKKEKILKKEFPELCGFFS
uniref:BZIP transcription factor ABF8 n=1 Tax=Tamarix hispida TaxID=189793 RepID=J9ZZY8_9CARY|nr:bZIP transcription factor ABF8 [Tamarix hispida]